MKPVLRCSALLFATLAACAGPAAPAAPAAAAAAPGAHVVIVTIDGLRADAAGAARAQTLARLAGEGASTSDARAIEPTETLPSHLAMATGLTADHHGITTNHELKREIDAPTVFTVVHAAGLATALYYGKAKLIALAPRGSADLARGPASGDKDWHKGDGATLAAAFAEEFPRRQPALAWVHLRDPDMVGHAAGWMSPPYLDAVRQADAALATIVAAIDASPAHGTTTLIVTADHGGEGIEHWGRHPADLVIPWLCRGPGAKAATTIHRASTLDVAPTALALLGLPGPAMDGKAVAECLAKQRAR